MRFEAPPTRREETPEFSEERVERISQEIMESQECLRYLELKIREKIEFKQQISHDDGTNNFSTWKRLGIFIVHEQRLPQALISILRRNGVDIYDDEVLELHIPPQKGEITDVKKSLDRLREYLRESHRGRPMPKFIYGVSYLAKLARRWGFTIIDLPEAVQAETGAANLLRSYADTETDPQKQKIARKFKVQDIQLCYMSVEKLLQSET